MLRVLYPQLCMINLLVYDLPTRSTRRLLAVPLLCRCTYKQPLACTTQYTCLCVFDSLIALCTINLPMQPPRFGLPRIWRELQGPILVHSAACTGLSPGQGPSCYTGNRVCVALLGYTRYVRVVVVHVGSVGANPAWALWNSHAQLLDRVLLCTRHRLTQTVSDRLLMTCVGVGYH